MYSTEMATFFKDRNNPEQMGVVVGSVTSVNPLQISIYNGNAILSKANNNLYIGSMIQTAISVNYTLDNIPTIGSVSTTGTIKMNVLKVGDLVACMPSGDGQKFYVFDKVV